VIKYCGGRAKCVDESLTDPELRTVTDALVLTMGVFLFGTYLVGRAIA